MRSPSRFSDKKGISSNGKGDDARIVKNRLRLSSLIHLNVTVSECQNNLPARSCFGEGRGFVTLTITIFKGMVYPTN